MQAATHSIYSQDRSLTGKRVGVLGLARSGLACIEFLKSRGSHVTALDLRPFDQFSEPEQEVIRRADVIRAPHGDFDRAMGLDALVLSPGVPTDAPIVRQAAEAGAEIIGEVELAYRFMDAPIVAVTGTCGKGTTVTTLGALLAAGDIAAVVAGNIGTPLIGQVEASSSLDVVVAEISSFQLEAITHFHPHIAALLNVTEDHLERYDSFDEYAQTKLRVFGNQTESDFAIFCVDDPIAARLAGRGRGESLTVSLHDAATNAWLRGEDLMVRLPGQKSEAVAAVSDLTLGGDHHVINALTAALIARLCGVHPAAMPAALRSCHAAPHLLQFVAEVNGVRYIDDSKATNPASAIADLQSIRGPVIVIAGGKEKQTDFAAFGERLARRAKFVVLIGECAARIEQAVARPDTCRRASSMQEAVAMAAEAAQPGDTVALCPACSSLDMFESYAARGDIFAGAVRQLPSQQSSQE